MRTLPLLALLSLSACAQEEPGPCPARPPREEALLARISERSASVRDLQASFVQSALREGLSKPVLSSGTLLYRADPSAKGEEGAVLMQKIDKPEPTVIRVTRNRAETYLPEDRTLEIADLTDKTSSEAMDATLLLYGKSRAFWERHYLLSVPDKASPEDPDELLFVPKDEGLKKTLLEIRLWVDPETALPLRMRHRLAKGQEISIAFSDLKVNRGLKESDLALEVPVGTEILRPSAGEAQDTPEMKKEKEKGTP